MAQLFDRAVTTNSGFALLAKAQSGQCKIVFTKIAVGDGKYTTEEKAKLILATSLKNQRNAYEATCDIYDNNARAKALITNRDPISKKTLISEGYHINEMGLFAREDTEGAEEILYSIVTVAGEEGDFIPAYTTGAPTQINQSWIVAVSNTEYVEIKIPEGNVATQEDIINLDNKKADKDKVYTKEESDNKYQPKGDYETKVYEVSGNAPTNTKLLWIDTGNGCAMRYYDAESSSWKFIPGVYGGQ